MRSAASVLDHIVPTYGSCRKSSSRVRPDGTHRKFTGCVTPLLGAELIDEFGHYLGLFRCGVVITLVTDVHDSKTRPANLPVTKNGLVT